MSEPKWPMVLRPNPLSMGVPVKPTSTALGSAWAILAPSSPYWVRWASSTMMMTLSEAFRTSSDPPGVSRASSNFWMVVMRVRPPPRWRRSAGPENRAGLGSAPAVAAGDAPVPALTGLCARARESRSAGRCWRSGRRAGSGR